MAFSFASESFFASHRFGQKPMDKLCKATTCTRTIENNSDSVVICGCRVNGQLDEMHTDASDLPC